MALYRSRIETEGPSHFYYNASIINNNSSDLSSIGVAAPDPQVRFSETRQSALIDDSSQYYFSIVRFTADGIGRNLPLFIPAIQLGQTDVNLTTYSVSLTLQQTWNVSNLVSPSGQISFAVTPNPTFVRWVPECQNLAVAPIPAPPLRTQDISTRYYYCGTYQWFVNLVNDAMIQAQTNLYVAFQSAWNAAVAADAANNPFPYPTLADFTGGSFNTPVITYDGQTLLFSFWMDSRGFGTPITPFAAVPYAPGAPGPATSPRARLFMNTNAYGLFANVPSVYWNTTNPLASLVFGGGSYPSFGGPTPAGYTYEILAVNEAYQNVVDFSQAPYGQAGGFVPVALQQRYYKMTQEFPSVDSLWSPVESLVFTTSLLPVKSEAVAAPTILGQGNLGASAPTSQSAFTPIITDIALDTTVGGSGAYRQFISYIPSGEYRLSDFTPSRTTIQQVDIQLFFKNRLDSQLIPITMYNLSTVSFKLLFRKKKLGNTQMDEL